MGDDSESPCCGLSVVTRALVRRRQSEIRLEREGGAAAGKGEGVVGFQRQQGRRLTPEPPEGTVPPAP